MRITAKLVIISSPHFAASLVINLYKYQRLVLAVSIAALSWSSLVMSSILFTREATSNSPFSPSYSVSHFRLSNYLMSDFHWLRHKYPVRFLVTKSPSPRAEKLPASHSTFQVIPRRSTSSYSNSLAFFSSAFLVAASSFAHLFFRIHKCKRPKRNKKTKRAFTLFLRISASFNINSNPRTAASSKTNLY